MANKDERGAQTQTHPNLDKKEWQATGKLQLKGNGKPFPVNTDVGVLKWRFQTQDESFIPLSINCWPNESASGVEVNIEYTLEMEEYELRDVRIEVPLPSGAAPVVANCDGDYKHEKGRNLLVWSLPVVDSSNSSGTLDFSTALGHADDFFPVRVSFVSTKLFSDIMPMDAKNESGEAVTYSQEATFFTEKYEVV